MTPPARPEPVSGRARRRWGFATRLALANSLLIVVACLTLGWIIVRRDLEEISRSLVERGRTISLYLARDAELSILTGDTQALEQLAHSAHVQHDVVYCRFFDRGGRLLSSDGDTGDIAAAATSNEGLGAVGPLARTPQVWEFQAPVLTADSRRQREELEFGEEPPALQRPQLAAQQRIGTVVIGISLVPLHALRQRVFVTAAFFAALVTVLAVIGAVVMARAITHPLQTLAKAADAIARGEWNSSVAIHTRDEVGALAASFNTMVHSVASSRAALEDYSRTLEEKVQARTERLEVLNRELQEANRLKSEFVATVSHELRTPLNVIMGYCEMLMSGAGGRISDEQRTMLTTIERYSQQQLELVTNVLDFSRLASGKVSLHVERFALAPLLADIATPYQARLAQAGIQFSTSVAAGVPELRTDRIKLQEVIRNLVDNAVKHTAAGRIAVDARVSAASAMLLIEVRDTGPGIPAEALPGIFEPFHQAVRNSGSAAGGVGLGLSIVKHLVNVLGGTVAVESRLGEGSAFSVEIPARLDGPSDRDSPVPAPSPPAASDLAAL
ncbi:MAG: HAMP domain-containing protein [Deltaproteobacteria bacterium]|nr:HAMP domain-containing protein [Deltaproteobacteria bacterium]